MFSTVITQIVPGISAVTFTESFTSQTSVTVTHNLGYRPPAIMVIDGSNNSIDFELTQTSVNAFTITFAVSQTGTILYR
ncbi:MAG: hypothetical protein H8D23_18315 [Candidatus Brocadiales bacterium]|nr:hypothetical protein [Candidatus Brocadiales bacterium]